MQLRLEITLDIQKQCSKTKNVLLSQITTLIDIEQGRDQIEDSSPSLEALISNLALQEYIEKKIQRITI